MNKNKSKSSLPDVTLTERVPPHKAMLDGPDTLILFLFSLSEVLHETGQLLFPLVCQLHDAFQVLGVLVCLL